MGFKYPGGLVAVRPVRSARDGGHRGENITHRCHRPPNRTRLATRSATELSLRRLCRTPACAPSRSATLSTGVAASAVAHRGTRRTARFAVARTTRRTCARVRLRTTRAPAPLLRRTGRDADARAELSASAD